MPLPTDRNTDPSFIYAILAILVIICLSIVSPFIVEPAMNKVSKELELQEFETAFNTVQHPGQTERIALQKAIGLLTDNSKSCDLFIGEMRSHSGNQDQILAYYAGQKVKSEGRFA